MNSLRDFDVAIDALVRLYGQEAGAELAKVEGLRRLRFVHSGVVTEVIRSPGNVIIEIDGGLQTFCCAHQPLIDDLPALRVGAVMAVAGVALANMVLVVDIISMTPWSVGVGWADRFGENS